MNSNARFDNGHGSRLVRAKRVGGSIAWYVVACAMAVVFVLPFFWMLSAAFKTAEQCVAYPPQWIPKPFTLRCF